MSTPRIALATAEDAWSHDEDADLLIASLEAAGADPLPAVWSDPTVDWSVFDLVVIRSTWDYTRHLTDFLDWAALVEATTPLANPASVIRWNTDKRYLAELDAAGLPVVPTRFLDPDSDAAAVVAAIAAASSEGDGDVVVKPTVSAGSQDTARYGPDEQDAAGSHATALLDLGRPVMVQPYMSAVDSTGETGMVFFDGRFSHGFRKGALLLDGAADVDGLFAVENISPRHPDDSELRLAGAVLDETNRLLGNDSLLYARVDVLRGSDGEPALLELELTEPSFFLAQDSGAPARAAAALVERAQAVPRSA